MDKTGERADATAGGALPITGFLLIGGLHHMLHLIPAAAALANRRESKVIVFVTNEEEEAACRSLLQQLEAPDVQVSILTLPRWIAFLGKINPNWTSLKVPRLIANRKSLSSLSGLVVAERTSTLLKRLPQPKPFIIHIPHGAGDRAKGFEKRIQLFDHVIVAGQKDRERMIAAGVATQQNCSVSGYIKGATVRKLHPRSPRLFSNDRPIILYNPHFDKNLSSWRKYGIDLLRSFSQKTEYNFIFAPHIRLEPHLTREDKRFLDELKNKDHIIIDTGSKRLTDMSYTLAADIYIGDVSSQVYEFLSNPRPCVFLLPDRLDYASDPNYAHCRFGDVCFSPDHLFEALAVSQEKHEHYRDIQRAGVEYALGNLSEGTAGRAAMIISQVIAARRASAPIQFPDENPALRLPLQQQIV